LKSGVGILSGIVISFK